MDQGSRSSDRRRRSGPIPERWLKCPRKSLSLLYNKFLIFKTPLDDKFNSQIPEGDRFPVEFVFMSMKCYKVKVGLWIDLTNTSRFYDPSDVEKNDCKYVKIHCQGRGQTPTEDQAGLFSKICDDFIRRNPLEVIGVHCTHGFNRSGFLLISYLVTMQDWDVEAGIREFARVRPPGIYKQDYINELLKLYGDEQVVQAPPLPDWCTEEEEGDDSGGESSNAEENNKRKNFGNDSGGKKRRKPLNKNPTFMEGVGDVEPVGSPLAEEIQKKVEDLCEAGRTGFPGSQPVSMTVQNMTLLHERPYRVSWKADGVRYLMYIQEKNKVYCIDRDNCVFQVNNLSFPYKKDLNIHLRNTLLDGEMVIDNLNGRKTPRYLVYDVIVLLDYPIRNKSFFPTRYEAIHKEITEPRYEAIRKGRLDKTREPFSVRPKEFCDVREARKFLSGKFARMLLHEPDGLIFQPSLDPYKSGRCAEILKWKPHTLNSIDFRLKIRTESGVGLLTKKVGDLYVGSLDRPFGRLKTIKNLSHLDNKIIECTFDGQYWVFLRERTDKSFPNAYETAKGVLESIRNPVTKEALLDYIEIHGYTDPMPPPSGPPIRFRK